MTKEILLNRMYSGDFLATEGNIGHEVVNLFKDDKGRNFIYVLSDGTVAKEHNNRVNAIVLVRWIGNHTMEILAKAEELTQIILRTTSGRGDRNKLHEQQVKYIVENDVTYGGVRLDTLFSGNIFHGSLDENPLYITFQTHKMRKPIRPIYIADRPLPLQKSNTYTLDGITFSKQSPKMYYEEGSAAYSTLESIMADDTLWEPENTTEPIKAELYSEDENYNFLKLIRKEYDELVFSNMFQHYFMRNPKVFAQFCREVLCGIEIDKVYTIDRETQDNIDLLVQDTNNVIVIENKIKSGINGIRHDVYSDEIQSQLYKYFSYATSIANGRKVSCFIFSPDYNQLDISNHMAGEFYTTIEYSTIYNFFVAHKEDYSDDKYFTDFLGGLYKHTLKVNSELFEEMRRKFSAKILEINNTLKIK
jgi:hypothetical protein